MINAIIKKNTYQDSVNLMLLSKKLSELESVDQVSVMMGTDANKDIMRSSNLITKEVEEANSNDLCCVISSKEDVRELVEEKMTEFFNSKNENNSNEKIDIIHSFSSLDRKMPNSNIAIFSIPGKYVYKEAKKALDKNMNVMIFSDNVSIEEEKNLKEYADKKDILVMGPDCGTTIIQNIPFAFANNLKIGNIGLIGASGTGLQEISTYISNAGAGISHAIGLGGRDLKEEIGGISAKKALALLEKDRNTDIIVFVSKPPSKKVMDEIIEIFEKINKPVVACFLGKEVENKNGVFYEKTLASTAKTALMVNELFLKNVKRKENPKVNGLYCGGTLANEAAILIEDMIGVKESKTHEKGIMIESENISVIDLGDDYYTQGKPHPMIDPSLRVEVLNKIKNKNGLDIVLLDNVIGYGAHDEMAEFTKKMARENEDVLFITSITGTELDFQDKEKERKILDERNIIVANDNEEAVKYAMLALNYMSRSDSKAELSKTKNTLLTETLNIVNIGITKFIKSFEDHNANLVQFDWKPVAGGDEELEKMLEDLR